MKKGENKKGEYHISKRMTGKESRRQENREGNHPEKNKLQQKETEKIQQIGKKRLGKLDTRTGCSGNDTQEPDTQNQYSRRKSTKQQWGNNRQKSNNTDGRGKLRRKTSGDKSNNCPIQKQMQHTRYRISKSPRVMRNIPKFCTTRKLQNRQVLRFNIRNPDPIRQLWGRRQENSEHPNHVCLIETMGKIREKENKISNQTWKKKTKRRNTKRKQH